MRSTCILLVTVLGLAGHGLTQAGPARLIAGATFLKAPPHAERARARGPRLVVRRALTPPKLDGTLDDACWRSAASVKGFTIIRVLAESAAKVRNKEVVDKKLHWDRFLQEALRPTESTRAWMTYDDRNLYIAFKCFESRIQGLRVRLEKFSFADDCVEVFLDPSRTWQTYYHFGVNSAGRIYDAKGENVTRKAVTRSGGEDSTWKSGAVAAVEKGAASWTVELAIPLKAIGAAPSAGEVWGLNLGREHPRKREYSTWAPVISGFCEPDRFGDLIFERAPAYALRSVRLGAPGWGGNVLAGQVCSEDGAALPPLDVVVEVTGPSGKTVTGKSPLRSQGAKAGFSVPYDIEEFGGHLLAVKVVSRGAPARTRARRNFAFDVPRALLSVVVPRNTYFTSDRLVRALVEGRVGQRSLAQMTLVVKLFKQGAAEPLAQDILRGLEAQKIEIQVNAANHAPGAYRLSVDLVRGGKVLATAEASFRRVAGLL